MGSQGAKGRAPWALGLPETRAPRYQSRLPGLPSGEQTLRSGWERLPAQQERSAQREGRRGGGACAGCRLPAQPAAARGARGLTRLSRQEGPKLIDRRWGAECEATRRVATLPGDLETGTARGTALDIIAELSKREKRMYRGYLGLRLASAQGVGLQGDKSLSAPPEEPGCWPLPY